ncbi:hypothetical protein [Nocardia sp. NPDC050710]|uniref:hypothetical protein n=1 Tax=Nocardia sp. NPDC050710 TaxID=3157220 RepID=UPI0033D2AA81
MTSGPSQAPRQDRGRAGIGTVVSAALLVAILLGGSIAFAINRTSDNQVAPTAPSTVPVPTSSVPGGGQDGFGVPEVDLFGRRVDIPTNPHGHLREQRSPQKRAGDSDWLTATPAGLREAGGWQRVHGVVVPFSTSDGPTRLHDGVPGGYARTPQGAALAAAMTVYQVAARPGDRAVLRDRLVLTAADQARFDEGIKTGKLPPQQPEWVTRTLLAYDAFRIDSYAEDLAVVKLALREQESTQTRSWVTATVPMVWSGGDWRLRGSGTQLPSAVTFDLAGWTTWS